MTPKIEICTEDVEIRSGTSKRGNDYELHLQAAYLHTDEPHPEKFEILLPKSDNKDEQPKPYKKGFYTLDINQSLVVRMGSLNIQPVLIPQVTTSKAAAN